MFCVSLCLRFLTFFEIPLGGATLNDVRYGCLVVKNLHDLRACIVDTFGYDLAALHVSLDSKPD